MKKILDGEQGSRNVSVDMANRSAVVDHCWKRDKASQRYQLRFGYDLSKVSDEEVWRYALLWINKDYQNRLRAEAAGEKELAEAEATPIDVHAMYERERAKVNPAAAVQRQLGKLSDSERADLMRQLEALSKAKK